MGSPLYSHLHNVSKSGWFSLRVHQLSDAVAVEPGFVEPDPAPRNTTGHHKPFVTISDMHRAQLQFPVGGRACAEPVSLRMPYGKRQFLGRPQSRRRGCTIWWRRLICSVLQATPAGEGVAAPGGNPTDAIKGGDIQPSSARRILQSLLAEIETALRRSDVPVDRTFVQVIVAWRLHQQLRSS